MAVKTWPKIEIPNPTLWLNGKDVTKFLTDAEVWNAQWTQSIQGFAFRLEDDDGEPLAVMTQKELAGIKQTLYNEGLRSGQGNNLRDSYELKVLAEEEKRKYIDSQVERAAVILILSFMSGGVFVWWALFTGGFLR